MESVLRIRHLEGVRQIGVPVATMFSYLGRKHANIPKNRGHGY